MPSTDWVVFNTGEQIFKKNTDTQMFQISVGLYFSEERKVAKKIWTGVQFLLSCIPD